jgi:type IV secretory pathway VirD2 relaxase
MPRRFIFGRNVNHVLDRPEELHLPMESRRDRVRFFAQKAIHRHRLPAPVRQLDARGPYVPAPSPQSRGAIVKIWPASASTTAAHSRYLTRGKGLNGMDAPLFDAHGLRVDRQAFAHRAAGDAHQFRLIVAAREVPGFAWDTFTQQWMAQVSMDVQTDLDWLGAVHHDTPHPHVHVQLRGVTHDGQPLYFSKPYFFQGLRYRAQELLTDWLGHLRPGQAVSEVQYLRQIEPLIVDRTERPRGLSPVEVRERVQEPHERWERLRIYLDRRGRGWER